MGPWQLRDYFAGKYYSKFYRDYPEDKFHIELILFKRLLSQYSYYLILEAIDLFFQQVPIDKADISYFAATKTFTNRFRNLIKLESIIEYRRFLPFYGEDKELVGSLIQEYVNYLIAISLSSEEVSRKAEILLQLGEINAKRIGREKSLLNAGPQDLQ